jgi:hypothetical protein
MQVLGFVGAPFTLASYIIEGGSSKNFSHVKQMAFSNPEVLHALNSKLAESVADYVRYQVCMTNPVRYQVGMPLEGGGAPCPGQAACGMHGIISSRSRHYLPQLPGAIHQISHFGSWLQTF